MEQRARMDEGSGAAMAPVDGIAGLTPDQGPLVVVVGVFDGLHLGHQYLLEHLAREAHRRGARAAVITFDHHPDEILRGSAPPLLCDPDERLARLAAAGVDVTVVQTFDVSLRMTRYDAFVAELAARVSLAGFVMTPDSAFGFERQGTPETVAALGARLGYEVVVVPAFTLDGAPVRSTDIRAAIATGDFGRAARLLGRPVGVAGTLEPSAPATVRFAVPVALPPDGEYPAQVATAGLGSFEAAVTVDRGVIRLGRPVDVPSGAGVRVTFVGA